MRVDFVSRSVVCLAAMPPDSLDLATFEAATDLGRPLTQVINPQIAVADYGRLRVLIAPGQPSNQVQLEIPGNASRELCRQAATELIRQAAPYALRGIGFNGFARIQRDHDGEDPVRFLLNEEQVNARLGTPITRAGAKLVFPMDGARATLDISPDAADETGMVWLSSVNRHYGAAPDAGEQTRAISWFAALSDELVRTLRNLIRVNDEETADVA